MEKNKEQNTGKVSKSTVQRLVMPLLLPCCGYGKPLYAPSHIPFGMLDAKMAKTVHGQTLERLAERGGLSPSEMLALMTKQNIFNGEVAGVKLYGMSSTIAVGEINKLLEA